MAWTLSWCQRNNVGQVVFLGRDGLPMHAAARYLQPALGTQLSLHVADVPRALLDSPWLDAHLARAADFRRPAMLVDSGCYGTSVTRVANYVSELTGQTRDLAVAFFASRNPRIFGYLNYLMGWHYLAEASPPHGRGPIDFVIYACDVLESLPKPYQVSVGDKGIQREPAGLGSFVFWSSFLGSST